MPDFQSKAGTKTPYPISALLHPKSPPLKHHVGGLVHRSIASLGESGKIHPEGHSGVFSASMN